MKKEIYICDLCHNEVELVDRLGCDGYDFHAACLFELAKKLLEKPKEEPKKEEAPREPTPEQLRDWEIWMSERGRYEWCNVERAWNFLSLDEKKAYEACLQIKGEWYVPAGSVYQYRVPRDAKATWKSPFGEAPRYMYRERIR